MMKKPLPKIILLFLLFIVGCKGMYSITDVSIYKGTDGLAIKFIENAPPNEVFEKTILPLGIMIRNAGAYDIENGLITFSLEEDYMLLDKTSTRTSGRGKKSAEERFDWIENERISWIEDKPQIKFSLNGKTIERAEGEEEIMTLKAEARPLEELSQTHEPSILATACYDYKTELVAAVCVDTDVYGIKKITKSCKVKELGFSSQGAPVAITRIGTEIMPMDIPDRVRPQFLIQVQNKGDGLVIKDDMQVITDACSEKSLNYTELSVVFINAYLGGEQKQLNCNIEEETQYKDNKKTGLVKLRDNTGIARCVLDEGIDEDEGTYVSPLKIELRYGYTNTISKNVVIKKQLKY